MKEADVPQDAGPESAVRRLMWAVDERGRFITVPSVGWDPSNTGFLKYWEYLGQLIHEARHAVERGEKSPLWYWMKVNILDERMLAAYTGLWTWRVKRHMRPALFARLDAPTLGRYAAVFRIGVEELKQLPATDPADLPIPPETPGTP